MGSLVSPIVANIYMEAFEHRAINTALNPPGIWRRYVDDTFLAQQQSHKEEFFQHINTVDPSIQFTVEEARPDGSISFLDILVTPQKMEPSLQKYTESPPTLIYTSSEIVTTILQQNTV